KGADIASLSPYLTKYVSHVFALGKDAHLFEKSFAHTTRVATIRWNRCWPNGNARSASITTMA
ncbi:MAG TPA: hypothetical protein EYO87_09160, partial [Paracoccus sp.]|nr:hypothetical protein [Paracoccus sp. (in: a-proteobacteria)]